MDMEALVAKRTAMALGSETTKAEHQKRKAQDPPAQEEDDKDSKCKSRKKTIHDNYCGSESATDENVEVESSIPDQWFDCQRSIFVDVDDSFNTIIDDLIRVQHVYERQRYDLEHYSVANRRKEEVIRKNNEVLKDQIREGEKELKNVKVEKERLENKLADTMKKLADETCHANTAGKRADDLEEALEKVEEDYKKLKADCNTGLNFMFYMIWRKNPNADFSCVVDKPKEVMDMCKQFYAEGGDAPEDMPSLACFERLIKEKDADEADTSMTPSTDMPSTS